MDELKPSEDLRQRCSDILEWRQTGSLPFGAALRAFAEQPRFDRHESDRLRAAEDATLHEAATLIATWNTRAASGGDSASLEQRAQGHIAMLRSLRLMYDDGVFGDGDHLGTTAALDAAIAALVNQQGVGGAWLGTDIDSLRSIVLDETGCMVDLALYIASPNDGGPAIRQGRYDAAYGFVDSTTGRRIDVDAWSAPSRALTQPAGDAGRES